MLIVDCTKTTRTVAAMILGCRQFDPDLDLKGVILNHIAGTRHEKVIRKAVEEYCGLPILGAIPRMPSSHFPERHLGLLPFQEHPEVEKAVQSAQKMAEGYLDLDRLSGPGPGGPAYEILYPPKVLHKKTRSSLTQPFHRNYSGSGLSVLLPGKSGGPGKGRGQVGLFECPERGISCLLGWALHRGRVSGNPGPPAGQKRFLSFGLEGGH